MTCAYCLSVNISISGRRLTTCCGQEGIPVVKRNVVGDVLALALAPDASGCFLNLSNQQQTDAYVCEIAPQPRNFAQCHLFEGIVNIVKERGVTPVWQDEKRNVTFEWEPGRSSRFR